MMDEPTQKAIDTLSKLLDADDNPSIQLEAARELLKYDVATI